MSIIKTENSGGSHPKVGNHGLTNLWSGLSLRSRALFVYCGKVCFGGRPQKLLTFDFCFRNLSVGLFFLFGARTHVRDSGGL